MKITTEKILFFDLDGVLIDTDFANWLAYQYACKNIEETKEGIFYSSQVVGEDGREYFRYGEDYFNHLMVLGGNRVTKDNFEDKDIVEYKQSIEKDYVGYTKKIEENVSILKRFSQTNKIILVSNCRKERGLLTLGFHKLNSHFHKMFFYEDKTLSESKYENAIKLLGIAPKDVIVFEDSTEEIEKAKEAGIQYINVKVEGDNIKELWEGAFKYSTNKILRYRNDAEKIQIEIDDSLLRNILNNKEGCKVYIEESGYLYSEIKENGCSLLLKNYKILEDGLKEFIIESNNFLKQNIQSYYSKDYFGGGNWNLVGKIEHLIWSLKNDEGCKSHHKRYLSTAYKRIKNILQEDLLELRKRIGEEKLTVCVVPRAKEEYLYKKEQLLFKKAVSDVVDGICDVFDNGTDYMIRHTDTKTNHLRNSTGVLPYVGITKDTCYISENVIGKNILLIDDVYTKTTNVDEDAIQALLDKGAKNVWFYSIGKTYSYI